MLFKNFKRYIRAVNLGSPGLVGQYRLAGSKVAIIGAGGLGCAVADILVRAGVGELFLVDGDKVAFSNLHRQTLFTESDVGRLKVEAAHERLMAVNQDTTVKTYPVMLDDKLASTLFSGLDLVIDCTDSIENRYRVNHYALIESVPWVYASLLRQEGQVATFGWPDGPCYSCLFPQAPKAEEVPTCNSAGVWGSMVNLVALWQAQEAMHILATGSSRLAGKVLLVDGVRMSTDSFTLKQRSDCFCAAKKQEQRPEREYRFELDWEQALHEKRFCFVDIREGQERQAGEQPPVDCHLPWSTWIEGLLSEDYFDKPVAVYCQTGVRSRQAQELLSYLGYESVSIKGGAKAFGEA